MKGKKAVIFIEIADGYEKIAQEIVGKLEGEFHVFTCRDKACLCDIEAEVKKNDLQILGVIIEGKSGEKESVRKTLFETACCFSPEAQEIMILQKPNNWFDLYHGKSLFPFPQEEDVTDMGLLTYLKNILS